MNIKATFGAMAVTLCAAISAPAQANERILFNCFFPPQNPVCRVWLPELSERIETATEGRVTMTIPPKSLAGPQDQYDAIIGGVMDGGIQFNAFISHVSAGSQLGLLPFIGSARSGLSSPALWSTFQEFFADQNEFEDVVLITVFAASGSEIFSTTEDPILTIADMANRKMWALPGVTANVIIGTGSSVVAGPAVQMLEIISKGVVDGYAGIPWSGADAFKLTDYTTSVTLTETKLFQPTFSLFVSRAKWDNISSEDQAAIMEVAGGSFAQWAGAQEDELNIIGRENLMAAGVEVYEASEEMEAELKALGQPLVDAWIARVAESGIDGQEVIDFYQAEIARLAAASNN